MQPTTEYSSYLPVGQEDDTRLKALGSVWNPISIEWLSRNVKTVSPGKLTMLEVGCGNNTLVQQYAALNLNGDFTCVDTSELQIETAKTNLEGTGLINIAFKVEKVENLDKWDEVYKVVHCRYLLSHIGTDIGKAVDNMLSRVEPGGVLVVEELSDDLSADSSDIPDLENCITAGRQLISLAGNTYDATKVVIDHIKKQNYHWEQRKVDLSIVTQEQKSFFRQGAEKMSAVFTNSNREDIFAMLGYKSGQEWISNLKRWELDPETSGVIKNYTQIAIFRPCLQG